MTEIPEGYLPVPFGSPGEIVDASDSAAVARVIERARALKREADAAVRTFTDALDRYAAETVMKRTWEADGVKVSLSSGYEVVYDAEALLEQLPEAGVPQQVIDEIVTVVVEHKVDAVRLKQAAAANPAVAEVVANCSERRSKSVAATIVEGPTQEPTT